MISYHKSSDCTLRYTPRDTYCFQADPGPVPLVQPRLQLSHPRALRRGTFSRCLLNFSRKARKRIISSRPLGPPGRPGHDPRDQPQSRPARQGPRRDHRRSLPAGFRGDTPRITSCRRSSSARGRGPDGVRSPGQGHLRLPRLPDAGPRNGAPQRRLQSVRARFHPAVMGALSPAPMYGLGLNAHAPGMRL
jgi:hypothetical protein